MTFTYFAYGSNMLSTRLIERCPSAAFICTGIVPDYALEFTKRSIDGSGKATLTKARGKSGIPGVVFEIKSCEREALDRAEGAGNGYDRVDEFPVISGGKSIKTTTYLATERQKDVIPYDWYLALVIAGAIEHKLDASHIDYLRAIKYTKDLEKGRKARTLAIQTLKVEGHIDHLSLMRDIQQ